MSAEAHRRLLLVADEVQRSTIRGLLDRARWELVETDELKQARFMLQGQTCDVVVVGGAAAGVDWSEGLAWLAAQAPIVVVGDVQPEALVAGLRQGALWLPGDAAWRSPLFAAVLDHALWLGCQRRQAAADRITLRDCQARVDRLLELLWEAAPGEGPLRWFTQRHMLERLDEEVARSQRSGAPLAVVLGELQTDGGERLSPDQAHRLASWAAYCIARGKRRCDVAGQYGLHGFMLLLPQASPEQAQGACQRLRALLAHPPQPDVPAVHVRFGVSCLPADVPSVEGLLRRAEDRLAVE